MKSIYTTFFLLVAVVLQAQYSEYAFERELEPIKPGWQRLLLPNSLLGRLAPTLSDLRVVGQTATADTVEVPYLLNILKSEVSHRPVPFTTINKTRLARHTYVTFMLPQPRTITQIELDFGRKNFNWYLDLEGSNDQQTWFSIRRGYRVVSIQNKYTDYVFSTLHFQPVQYKYYRLRVRNEWFAFFRSAKLYERKGKTGEFRTYACTTAVRSNSKQPKNTLFSVLLPEAVPIAELSLRFRDTVDYVRPIQIEYLKDSVKTEKGWKRYYQHLYTGTLSSFEKQVFRFENTITKELQVKISNHDNQPLKLESASVLGNVYEMTLRMPELQSAKLLYGNDNASAPQYDLQYFKKNIPKKLPTIQLLDEKQRSKKREERQEKAPKFWIWISIGLIGALLAVFSFRMLKQGGPKDIEG